MTQIFIPFENFTLRQNIINLEVVDLTMRLMHIGRECTETWNSWRMNRIVEYGRNSEITHAPPGPRSGWTAENNKIQHGSACDQFGYHPSQNPTHFLAFILVSFTFKGPFREQYRGQKMTPIRLWLLATNFSPTQHARRPKSSRRRPLENLLESRS